jgi:drug/metabolite transporter (DMT)-like permease
LHLRAVLEYAGARRMKASIARARLSALTAALLFGTGGAAIKSTTLAPIQVACLRSGVAAVALVLLLPAARRGFGRDLALPVLSYAATLVSFVIATKLTTSAAAIFLQSTAPLWVTLLAPLLLRERFDPRDLGYLVVAALGLLLVFLGSRDPVATAPAPQLGNTIALGSGLFFALLLVTFRRLARGGVRDDRTLPAAALGNAVACLACLPFALPVTHVAARDVWTLLYLGVVQVAGAYWFLGRALQSLPAFEVSVLLLLEPVTNPLLTWALHGEAPSALALLGGGVLVGVLLARAMLYSGPSPGRA